MTRNEIESRAKMLCAVTLVLGAFGCEAAPTDDPQPEDDAGTVADGGIPRATEDAGEPTVEVDASTEPPPMLDGGGPMVVDAGPPRTVEEPCGLYTLSQRVEMGGTLRSFAGDRDVPYVAGFVIRPTWDDLEPTEGDFDFSTIEDAIERVHANGQRLTLQILGTEPDHVIADAEQTWRWYDTNPRHTGPCTVAPGCLRPLPWDGPSLARQEQLVRALADHLVDTPSGPVRLADHPVLDQVLMPLVGWGRIRELGVEVEDWVGYTRARLIDATLDVLRMHHRHFPDVVHQVQFFKVRDDGTDGLWRDLIAEIIAGLAADGYPTPIFLMENLVHGVSGGVDNYRPSPTMAAEPLVVAGDMGGFVGFQMLTSWARPFPGQEDAVAGGNPAAAIRWANATYGARYFEIYPPDVDAAESSEPAWRADLADVARELCP